MRLQETLCREFCERTNMEVINVFSEVVSGASFERSVFSMAVSICLAEDAVLVATKIDRLSRRISVVGDLIDKGVRIKVVQLGGQEVNPLLLGVFASLAHAERNLISARTKEALAQLKREGVKLGNPNASRDVQHATRAVVENARTRNRNIMRAINEVIATGLVKNEDIAFCLNARGMKTARGKAFTRANVGRIRRVVA